MMDTTKPSILVSKESLWTRLRTFKARITIIAVNIKTISQAAQIYSVLEPNMKPKMSIAISREMRNADIFLFIMPPPFN